MCRNIRVLYNFEPPTTRDEIHAAATRFVRKVSGLPKPSAADAAAFGQAVEEEREKARALEAARRALRGKGPARRSDRRVSIGEHQSEAID